MNHPSKIRGAAVRRRGVRRTPWFVLVALSVTLILMPGAQKLRAESEDVPDLSDMVAEGGGIEDPEMAVLEQVIREEEAREGDEPPVEQAFAEEEFVPEESVETQQAGDPAAAGPAAPGEELAIDDEALGVPGDAELNQEAAALESEADALSAGEDTAFEGDMDAAFAPEQADPDLGAVPEMDFAEQGRQPAFEGEPGQQVRITNLEFRMDGANSRILVSSDGPLRYREVPNRSMNQIVYYFENTVATEKVQRAYDTTEFPSPVALFTLLQVPGTVPPQSKLIIQLREGAQPTVIPSEKGLFVDFGPPTKAGEDARLVYEPEGTGDAYEENIYGGGLRYTGRLIRRLEIKDSDVQDVLRLIARTSGYNIVVGDDVQGKVGTLSLENIPWDQAFTLILQMKKLGYVRQGNVLRVATLRSLQDEKQDALANEKAKIQVQALRTVLIPVSYATAGDLAPKAKTFLTERGSVETDKRTNTLIVKDIPEVVEKIRKLFAALDTQPPRVSISARIVEMKNSFRRTLGFNDLSIRPSFGGVNLTQLFTPQSFPGATSTTILSAPQFNELRVQFDMGESEGKVRTLANPSVSVVANQAARINQSNSFFIETAVPTTGGVVQGQQQVTTNLSLEVTPIVAADGTIFLTVNITNEVPVGSGAETQIDSRNVETQVLVENGDTLVVGSIFSNTVRNNLRGVPFLMRVPILGFFFSAREEQDDRNETFVFLTAKIMNAESSFKRTL